MRDTAGDPEAEEEGRYPPPKLAWAIVAMLFVAYIFSFIDRMIIGLLVEPMKADLGVTDTQISLLQGMAFALFYTLAGLPIARLIDRKPRMRIIAAGVAVWSLMTAACGVATQYWHLFIARMGVGVGEATLSPAAYSLITDSFPKKRLGLAMGVYGLGSAVGAGLAFLIGAAVVRLVVEAGEVSVPLIGAVSAWQLTFLIVGLPGLLIALVFQFMPEPPRGGGATSQEGAPLSEVFRFIRSRSAALGAAIAAVSLVNFAVLGSVSWVAVMFVRVHEFSLSDAGAAAGFGLIIGGVIGLIGGGVITDRMDGGSPHGRLKFCAMTAVTGTIGALIFPLASSPTVAVAAFILFFASAAVPVGAAITAIQQMTPAPMRATIGAVYIFVVNIVGLALGPSATALIGDTFYPTETGIRYAIVWVAAVGFFGAGLLFALAASRTRSTPAPAAALEPAPFLSTGAATDS
ncbi:MAG: MFS transporter [Pseudomonadota bacterium]